jgi:dihydroxy-acid dehydratase
MKIVELVKNNVTADKVITKEAILNAVKVCIAIGGSTNVVMHLIALAKEAKLDIDVIDAFDKLSYTIPTIARVNPSSYEYNCEDFWRAGGIVRVMENLAPMLDTTVMTASGHTLRENIDSYIYKYPKNDNVIKTLDAPFGFSGAVAIMRGNLCPATGVAKPGAIDDSVKHFIGEAICFDCEEDANQAIIDGKVKDGHVVVIRYEGPKGGPGMREMYSAMKYLYGRGLAKSTALITDGRFSGSNNGCFIGHISPEAQEGGPIAIIRDGDRIEINIEKRTVDLLLSDEEIAARLAEWKAPELKYKSGYLGIYSKLAASAAEGAVLNI